MALHRDFISSCFECAAIESCYRMKHPDLTREEGRLRAAQCQSLRKGRVVETVRIMGQSKGLSRRNAENLVEEMKAVWVAEKTIRLVGT